MDHAERKRYPDDHWLRSHDPQKALAAYLDQQNKAYSRAKNAFILELLGDLKGKRFLDYGCGAGMFTVHAALKGASEVVGVDAEDTALLTAVHFARQESVHHLCRFIHSEKFPSFPYRSRFDVILMKDVIEHVPDDQGLLESAAACIVPGGHIVLSTQSSLSLNYLIQGTYHRVLRRDKEWFGWDETHLRFYTPMSLQKKLRDAGFSSAAWRSVYLVPYKLPPLPSSDKKFLRLDALSWIDKKLGRIFPYNRLGWNIIVKAEASKRVVQRVPIAPLTTQDLPAAPPLMTRESVRVE
jgi:2-polyprenyl-6-hydroxyphenyl methylase / 3-demethylubiquinone-9 3-methyltransferase